jgi:formate--tetrahydrofolate ligase
MPTDIEIARAATLIPISEVAKNAGVPDDALIPYGKYKAKVDTALLPTTSKGKLILVTAINPTPAGEGKTTTSVGLTDALHRIGKNAMLCLREPSLGPCFGVKGGAPAAARARSCRWTRSTCTSRAISTPSPARTTCCRDDRQPHLLGQRLEIDLRRVTWRRVLDMNDRALRQIVTRWAACPTASRAKPASTSPWLRKSWRSCASPPRS